MHILIYAQTKMEGDPPTLHSPNMHIGYQCSSIGAQVCLDILLRCAGPAQMHLSSTPRSAQTLAVFCPRYKCKCISFDGSVVHHCKARDHQNNVAMGERAQQMVRKVDGGARELQPHSHLAQPSFSTPRHEIIVGRADGGNYISSSSSGGNTISISSIHHFLDPHQVNGPKLGLGSPSWWNQVLVLKPFLVSRVDLTGLASKQAASKQQAASTRKMGKNHISMVVLRIRPKFWWMLPMGVRDNREDLAVFALDRLFSGTCKFFLIRYRLLMKPFRSPHKV